MKAWCRAIPVLRPLLLNSLNIVYKSIIATDTKKMYYI